MFKNKLRNILFGHEINVYSDHEYLIQKATLSESQRQMKWRLILEEFGPNIYHIACVNNIITDTLSRLKSSNTEEDKSDTLSDNKLKQYITSRARNIQADFP